MLSFLPSAWTPPAYPRIPLASPLSSALKLMLLTSHSLENMMNSRLSEMRSTSPLILVVLLGIICAVSYRILLRRKTTLYPPGRVGLPLGGNVLDIPNDRQWLEFDNWIRRYGTFHSVYALLYFFSMAQHLSLELHCYSNEIVWPFHVDCVRTPISELDLSPSGIQQAIPILNVQT